MIILTFLSPAMPHPNPYTLSNLFSSLPANSPLRQLASLDMEPGCLPPHMNPLGLSSLIKENGSPPAPPFHPVQLKLGRHSRSRSRSHSPDWSTTMDNPSSGKTKRKLKKESEPHPQPDFDEKDAKPRPRKSHLYDDLKIQLNDYHPHKGQESPPISVIPKREPLPESEDEHDGVDSEVDNKVRKLLDTVNSSVTRQQLFQACHFMGGIGNGGIEDSGDEKKIPEEGGRSLDNDEEEERLRQIRLQNNNNNSLDDEDEDGGKDEEKRKLNLLKSLNLKKKNGIEGLAARLQLELCQQRQQQEQIRHQNQQAAKFRDEVDLNESGVDDVDEFPSSQSENEESGEQSKLFILKV